MENEVGSGGDVIILTTLHCHEQCAVVLSQVSVLKSIANERRILADGEMYEFHISVGFLYLLKLCFNEGQQ